MLSIPVRPNGHVGIMASEIGEQSRLDGLLIDSLSKKDAVNETEDCVSITETEEPESAHKLRVREKIKVY